MRKVEKEEERSMATNPDKQCFHLCIINMVIGTLYCAKVRICHPAGLGTSPTLTSKVPRLRAVVSVP